MFRNDEIEIELTLEILEIVLEKLE